VTERKGAGEETEQKSEQSQESVLYTSLFLIIPLSPSFLYPLISSLFPIHRRPLATPGRATGFFQKEGPDPPKRSTVNLNEETQMNNKSITPNPQQPVDRVPTGQLPSALAELSEAELSAGVLPFKVVSIMCSCSCSYDGDDE